MNIINKIRENIMNSLLSLSVDIDVDVQIVDKIPVEASGKKKRVKSLVK